MLQVVYAEYHKYALYAECRYAECRSASYDCCLVKGYLDRQMIEAKTQVRAFMALLALDPLGNTTSIETTLSGRPHLRKPRGLLFLP